MAFLVQKSPPPSSLIVPLGNTKVLTAAEIKKQKEKDIIRIIDKETKTRKS